MRAVLNCAVTVLVVVGSPSLAASQRQADVDAINQLIDRYGALQDSMDMTGQARLMAPDRVWIVQGAGRRANQAMNMRIQQASLDQLRDAEPGIRTFTEDRDRLIRFYGNGSVAVVSAYRYTTAILPLGTPEDVVKGILPVAPSAVTMVMEKGDGGWKIVHTHISDLGVTGG